MVTDVEITGLGMFESDNKFISNGFLITENDIANFMMLHLLKKLAHGSWLFRRGVLKAFTRTLTLLLVHKTLHGN